MPTKTATRHATPSALQTALEALHAGNFSVRLRAGQGISHSIAEAFNAVASRNEELAAELTRLAGAVGGQGILGKRASLRGAPGGWAACVDAANALVEDLVQPMTEMARVIDAVAQGDLGRTMALEMEGRPIRGEFLRTARTVNRMVEQLKAFASEVTRVAREVGTEGKLGGQARVKGVAGTWRDLTHSVNSMAANLTSQVRNIAEVTTAVARGDLSKKITVDVKGEILELKDTINTMVDQLKAFASEVTRVAREVGTDGKLGGQARVEGVAGTWKGLTDNVNSMAENLTSQVRNIADVTTAVARGDLSKKITVDVKGEILELKDTINTMVDQLGTFASEVTRVAREVGTDGKLGGQARVKGVAGTWKDLTDNVNSMADNLTSQVRNIADVTTAVARGDLSKKVTVEVKGEILALKNTMNVMVDQLNGFASEVTRVAKEVGTDGRLGGQAHVRGVAGTWKDLTDSVNSMADNLTSQVRNIADVTTAVANGDLSKKITVDVRGEIRELKDTINTMVDQLNAFAFEVTRVAREVGTEGRLGGQAQVRGAAGVWKDLTDNVNTMAENLTAQVRGIAKIVTSVANGDLEQKLELEAAGEIAILAQTINEMIDTLAVFADQVSGVAREVGVEGRLGGQAEVPGASGTWRSLTDNVNGLAANLTTQVRAIAEVATAVTEGDLTRSISVQARGEVAVLKDNINEMIRKLKETTQKNMQQDWLNSNLARFGRMLQGQRDLPAVSQMVLSELAGLVSAQHGVFYVLEGGRAEPVLSPRAAYAYEGSDTLPKPLRLGQGLVGQCAVDRERILLTNVPRDYVRISSGLGGATPACIAIFPVLFEGQVKAALELASLEPFSESHLAFVDQLMESLGIVLNTIETTMQTEELLRQSQSLTQRLKAQQEELQKTNEQLQEKATLLTEQKAEVEVKNREVELASGALEEKAAQLALASKYKSEFLANMSHELRTPLNSLLILAKLMADDPEGNLTPKQIEFAETIYSSGRDLLALINEILDLSKIESGTMAVDVGEVTLSDIADFAERSFRQIADDKGLGYEVVVEPGSRPSLSTDSRRMQQILRNLLSNAFKFTERGSVTLTIRRATAGWNPSHEILSSAAEVVAFSVLDTGIGIPKEKQAVIFEAFQQADGTTSRRFGGTGLGLSISREIARILGGAISLESEAGRGSRFTLYLPVLYAGSAGSGQVAEASLPSRASTRADGVALRLEAAARPPASGHARAPASPWQATGAPQDVEDDRASIRSGDRSVLIVEDDPALGRAVLAVVREAGFKGVVARRGEWAVSLARSIRPKGLVIDRLQMGEDGGRAFEHLWHDPSTRGLPLHVLAAGGGEGLEWRPGPRAYLQKPLDDDAIESALARIGGHLARPVRRVLVVDAQEAERAHVARVVGGEGARATVAADATAAIEALGRANPDAVFLDTTHPETSAERLLDVLHKDPALRAIPLVLMTASPLPEAWSRHIEGLVSRVPDRSPDLVRALLRETAHFALRLDEQASSSSGSTPSRHGPDATLVGKRALVVDDDIRNVFAITSMLEHQGMTVRFATNGREAIAGLEQDPEVDVVLMDIMMPEMDGYETIRSIRRNPRLSTRPIVALTAKAMQGDREKCLEAGASDYITKPVETDQLLALLRVWLAR